MGGASGELFDRSAEVIGQRVAAELNQFHGQEITDPVIDAIRERVAESIGGLLGARDVADILGVSHQRVSQLFDGEPRPRATPAPSPIARVRATPIWFKADIEDYNQRRK